MSEGRGLCIMLKKETALIDFCISDTVVNKDQYTH